MGVLSALPIISAGNVCCCLWVLAGGLVAAYSFQHHQSTPIEPADGAIVGLLAGLIGAVVQVLISIPMNFFIGPMEREMAQRILTMAGRMPPEWRDAMEQYSRDGQSVALAMFRYALGFVFFLCVGAVFSTIGGLLGAFIFKKPATPGVIDVTPSN